MSDQRQLAIRYVGAACRLLLRRPPGEAERPLIRRLAVSEIDHEAVLRKLVSSAEFEAKRGGGGDGPSAYSLETDDALAPFRTPEVLAATDQIAAHERWATAEFSQFAAEALPDVAQPLLQGKYWRNHRERFRELLNSADFLLHLTKSEHPDLLEVGGSMFSALLHKAFPLSQIDILDQRLAPPKFAPRRRLVQLDLESVREPTDLETKTRYDLVFFSEVLEHLLANPVVVLRFLLHQVKPGGFILLTTPNLFAAHSMRRIMHRQNPNQVYPIAPKRGTSNQSGRDVSHHVRLYCMSELLECCREVGAEIFAFRFSSYWDNPAAIPSLPADQRRALFVVAQKKGG